MSCSEVMELMQRYLDHDLTEMEQQTMVSHFNHCPECAAMFERMQQVSEGLESLPDVQPPYSIVDSILPMLDNVQPELPAFTAIPGGSPTGSRKDRRKLASRFVYGGTAAAALILGVYLFQTYLTGANSGGKSAASGAVPEAAVIDQYGTTFDSGSAADPKPDLNEKSAVLDKMASPSSNEGGEDRTKMLVPQKAADTSAHTDSPMETRNQAERSASNEANTAQDGSAARKESDSNTGLTSSIASTPADENPSVGGAPSIAGIVPNDKLSENLVIGTGTFVQPAEISLDGEKDKAESSHSKGSGGLFLGGNVDLSHLASPNGKYLAVVENQRVAIRDKAGSVLFESPVQWEEGDAVQLTEWPSNYQLFYVVKRSDGDIYEYMIDLALKQELKK